MWTINENKDWKYLEDNFEWVKAMQEVPQDKRYHAEGNVAIHTQMVLAALQREAAFLEMDPQEQEIMWAAALLHDVEKRSTTVLEQDGSITSHGHARKGALTARQILYREIATPFKIREQVVSLVRYHGLPIWILEKSDPLKELIKASMEVNMQWLALLARADVLGRTCDDKDELLYRISCFEEFCKEHDCWGITRNFASSHARMNYLSAEHVHPDYAPYDSPVFEVVLMSGLPGAGKDSFIRKHFKDMPVVSIDQIREEMGVSATDKTGNGQAIQASREKARSFLRTGTGFVWNGTNVTRQMRMQLIDLFTTYKAKVKIVYVEAPYRLLHQQNKNREAMVPAIVIERLIDKLEVPAEWEAHEVVYRTQ